MKRITALLLSSFAGASLVAAGCGNGSLLAPSPSGSDDAGTLALSAIHHLHDGSALEANEAGDKIVINDLGFQMTLHHASVGYQSLTLISSGDDPECTGGNDVTVTINGSDDFLAEDLVASTLGEHAIPLATFCSYSLTLGPAKEESSALKFHTGEDHGTGEVHGAHATLHLEGTWSKDGGAETAFEIESDTPVEVTGVFGYKDETGAFVAHPLHFHEGETETEKTFGVKYDILFDGIDFQNDTAGEQHAKAAANLKAASHVHSAH